MSAPLIQSYLFFAGRCEEALEFYRTAVGAELLMLMRCKESPEPHQPGMLPQGSEEKVLHASFRIGASVVMASDGPFHGEAKFEGFALSLSVADEAAADRTFRALADAGQIMMPLAKTFWSPCFGMLHDRFGVTWMVTIPGQR